MKSEIRSIDLKDDFIISGHSNGDVKVSKMKENQEIEHLFEKNLDLGQINTIDVKNMIFGFKNGITALIGDLDTLGVNNIVSSHSNSVTSVSCGNKSFATASWDSTIKFWSISDDKEVNLEKELPLKGYIWQLETIQVEFKDKTVEIVVGCDIFGSVLFFYDNSLIKSYNIHSHCIRCFSFEQDLIKLGENFSIETLKKSLSNYTLITVSNHGIILKHTEKKIVAMKRIDCMLYKIKKLGNSYVLSGNEHKLLRISKNLENIFSVKTESETNWCLSISKNSIIFVGGDSGKLEIFDEKGKKISETDKKIEKNEDKKFENENFKIDSGKVYQKVNGDWEYIGEHVIQEDKMEKQYLRKEIPDSKKFSVDLEGKILNLEFKEDEDIVKVAKNFLILNHLDRNYESEVISFIKRNFPVLNSRILAYKEENLLSNIKIDKIEEYIKTVNNYEYIVELLKRAEGLNSNIFNENDCENIQKIDDHRLIVKSIALLKNIFESGVTDLKFVVLDIVRYLVLFVGIDLDPFFFITPYLEEKNIPKKEKIVLLRLIINLFGLNVCNMDIFKEFSKHLNPESSDYDLLLNIEHMKKKS